jgi:hypothetical protein
MIIYVGNIDDEISNNVRGFLSNDMGNTIERVITVKTVDLTTLIYVQTLANDRLLDSLKEEFQWDYWITTLGDSHCESIVLSLRNLREHRYAKWSELNDKLRIQHNEVTHKSDANLLRAIRQSTNVR